MRRDQADEADAAGRGYGGSGQHGHQAERGQTRAAGAGAESFGGLVAKGKQRQPAAEQRGQQQAEDEHGSEQPQLLPADGGQAARIPERQILAQLEIDRQAHGEAMRHRGHDRSADRQLERGEAAARQPGQQRDDRGSGRRPAEGCQHDESVAHPRAEREAEHDGERGAGIDAEHARIGERVARRALDEGAGRPERGADEQRRQRPGQPQAVDGGMLRQARIVGGQRPQMTGSETSLAP